MTFFLQYLLLPLLVMILAFAAVFLKKKNEALSNKKLIVCVLLFSLALALPCLLGFTGNDFTPWYFILTQIIDVGLGIAFVQFYSHYLEKDVQVYKKTFLSVVLFLCILLGGFLYAMFFNLCSAVKSGYIAATTIIVFPIPLLFYWTALAWLSIPFEIYTVWQYDPQGPKLDFDGLDFSRLMMLKLEFGRKQNDRDRSQVHAKAPAEVPFGNWFKKFIDDYNEKFPQNRVEYADQHDTLFNWIFYIKRSFFHKRQYIDPAKSIKENRIPEHSVIISKRVVSHLEEEVSNKNSMNEIVSIDN
ncbi:TssN family type VI secretion system protein [Chitinophagaceae bacterium 26-R-25]|nr:TssN family type VI secretion system protein [Chitinophagaceae bacterium 26-R-25]